MIEFCAAAHETFTYINIWHRTFKQYWPNACGTLHKKPQF